MERFVTLFVTGLAQGAVIAIVALGFLLIYKATGVVNFAQGDLVTLGTYVAIWASADLELPLLAAYGVAITALFVVGVLIERFAYAPIRNRSIHVVVISTLGAALVIRAGIVLWRGTAPSRLEGPLGFDIVEVLGARIPQQNLLIIGVTAVCVVAMALLFSRTAFGRQVRALATDRMAAQLQGVRVARMSMLTFGLSAGLSALAGVLIAPTRAVTIDFGFSPMLYAFAAAILGGMGSIAGVVVGAVAIGLVQQLGGGYLSPDYAEIYPFVLMLAVIALRPQGLFGNEAGARL
ncbi:MAG TPA: branched-chain amino acid ABC transporter permease [Acidimicrobiales bacterium]|jgi:branched-chain amino acid transport system permease protein|nr:branched-chain amino acid ABC transporter permease [Acidimicrobiales bacterium]